MSRRSGKRSAFRPAGVQAPATAQRVVDVVADFDQALRQAALANAVEARVPYGHVQQIVPGANYGGKPNTAAAAARLHAMKNGVDPALNKKFETATEAREFRRANHVEAMSPQEYDAETANMTSSRRHNPFVDGPIDPHRDPDTGRKVQGYDPAAFDKGAKIAAQMFPSM